MSFSATADRSSTAKAAHVHVRGGRQRRSRRASSGSAKGDRADGEAHEVLSRVAYLRAPEAERENLIRVCEQCAGYFDPNGPTTVGAEIAQFLASRLPEFAPTTSAHLQRARDGEVDAVYFVGLPTEREVARLVMLVLTYKIGMAFNYSTQNSGALVMALEPERTSVANTNTTPDEFLWHSDDAAVPRQFRVAWIQLYGIANPPKTLTGYAPIEPVQNYLPDWAKAALLERRYRVRVPISFGLGDGIWSAPRSILSLSEGGAPEIAWPSYATEPIDPNDEEARRALDELRDAVVKFAIHLPLNPGCFLAFNNLRGVHMRTRIGDGNRFIFRTYAREGLDDLRAQTGAYGPIFDTHALFPALKN